MTRILVCCLSQHMDNVMSRLKLAYCLQIVEHITQNELVFGEIKSLLKMTNTQQHT